MKIPYTGTSVGNIEQYRGRNDPEALKAVAREMEALFVYEMIKAMRDTVDDSSKDNFGKSAYMSIFDMELAKLLAEKGLGLQDLLLKGLRSADLKEKERAESAPSSSSPRREEHKESHPHKESRPLDAMPVKGVISSHYGMRRHPVYGTNKFHNGLDIAAPAGSKIYPLKDGSVLLSGHRPGCGNIVVIDHCDGYVTTYAHNKANLVKAGDAVTADTPIALVGSSGVSTGPHLHFEVAYRGERMDPMKVITRG
jgi:murein DD-endopeptidase MepM/ murein hydrolase activator NlpD